MPTCFKGKYISIVILFLAQTSCYLNANIVELNQNSQTKSLIETPGSAVPITCDPTNTGDTYGGGSGTSADPYLICSAHQLNKIGLNISSYDKHFSLTSDIDMLEILPSNFNMIGSSSNPFTGVLDGNQKTVRNFTVTGAGSAGIFKVVSGAIIKNMVIENATINGFFDVGTLIGIADNSSQIENIRISSSTITAQYFVGGIVGTLENSSIIKNCYFSGSVIAGDNAGTIGGVAGDSSSGVIETCEVTGNINIGINFDKYAGGIVGRGSARFSKFSGNLTVNSNGFGIGGIAGALCGHSSEKNIVSGNISAASSGSVGGIAGVLDGFYCGTAATPTLIDEVVFTGTTNKGCGILGSVNPPTNALIQNSASRGVITSSGVTAGFICSGLNFTISNSYITSSIPPSNSGAFTYNATATSYNNILYDSTLYTGPESFTAGDLVGVTGLTTSQMKIMNNFTAAGWSNSIWKLDSAYDGNYPKLRWEQ